MSLAPTDKVLIWSGEHSAYWRPGASGYTIHPEAAGLYTRETAERITRHCGPEKGIRIDAVQPGSAHDLAERARALLESYSGMAAPDWQRDEAAALEEALQAWDARHG